MQHFLLLGVNCFGVTHFLSFTFNMLLEKIVILQLSFPILQNMALNINLKEAGVDTDEIICRTYLLFCLSYVESLIRLSKNSRNGNADKQCVKKLNA